MRRHHLIALVGGIVTLGLGCGSGGDTTNAGSTNGVGGAGTTSGGGSTGGAGPGGNGGGSSTTSGSATGGNGGGSAAGGNGGGVASGGGSATGGSGTGGSGTGGSGTGGAGTGGSGGAPACVEGEVLPCYSGDPVTEGVGQCVAGTQTCTGGAFGPCVGEVVPAAEACNGVDDDCDGNVDEDFGTDTCGLGACQVTIDLCAGGVPQVCVPLPPAPAEACDGTDDDCDGTVDEGCSCIDGTQQPCYSGPAGTENVGVCTGGTQTCANGAWGACMGETLPAAESCNGIDDDCDANVDEGLGNASCGVGACQASTPNCIGGQVQVCQPGAPGTESCNGVDDDCDGATDEGLPPTTCGQGQCAVSVPSCVNGQPNVCTPGQPSAEVCDGLDNDCNGQIDNGNPGGGGACSTGNVGACAAGTTACSGGAVVCAQNVQPTADICDGIDNDCDGQTDEGNPGSGFACATGSPGACSAGLTSCSGGAIICIASNSPTPEQCDAVDNDCDGQTDEGNPGGGFGCLTGLQGVCSAGTTGCFNGSLLCVQNQQAGAEVCDGADNDCDGLVDEGNPGGGGACNTGLPGVCSAGVLTCQNGVISCQQTTFAAAQDICANGLDDDCNGQVDESVDQDGDGWGTCTGDCCDKPGPCSLTPALVNPGAFEVLNNSVNDDCDAGTSDSVPPVSCTPPPLQTPTTALKLVQAIDLCNFTTLNPPLPQKKWGVITNELVSAAGSIAAPPLDIQVGVLANYGPNVVPKKGTTMAAISSGTARDQGDPGWVQPNGGWQLGTTGQPPPVYLAAHGGVLQSKPGCPNGTGANDSVNLRVKIRVPTNAQSFSYKFKFYSSEYPEWVCTQYNDFYLALLTSGVAGIPADHNISFDSLNNPVSVNNGFFDVCQGCSAGTSQLVGTGMGGNGGVLTDGGGTVWLNTTSPIVPGEVMTIEFIIFDVGDHAWDSLTLLDAFEWALTPATVGTVVD